MVGSSNTLGSSMAAVTEHHVSGSITLNSVKSIVTEPAELISPNSGLEAVNRSPASDEGDAPFRQVILSGSGIGRPPRLMVSFKDTFSAFNAVSLSRRRKTSFSSSRM